ncbi:MAG: type II toxin-antitoxin system mRNA interferase toxin, RelE/StbE family [Deltaproteobacteria bacterium]|nr:type II toxin-antitoxin system mRNA interferase toxin, RelE/StbE family [Deltaproteobacteria bacterium]
MAINIVIPDSVVRALNALPKEIRLKFWEQLERLLANPAHPSLRNEKLKGTDQWAFSITMNYRATYFRDKSNVVITAIGTHKDVVGS